MEELAALGVYLMFLVPNTSHISQMMHMNPNARTQALFREQKTEYMYNNLNSSPNRRDLVAFLIKAARDALTPRNFAAAWKRVGILPWDPSKLSYDPAVPYEVHNWNIYTSGQITG